MNRNSRMWLLKHSLCLNCSFSPRLSIPGHFSGTYRPPTSPTGIDSLIRFCMSVFLCHRPTPDSLVRRQPALGEQENPHRRWVTQASWLFLLGWSNGHALTHAVLHHHESASIAFIALALKVPGGCSHTGLGHRGRGYHDVVVSARKEVSSMSEHQNNTLLGHMLKTRCPRVSLQGWVLHWPVQFLSSESKSKAAIICTWSCQWCSCTCRGCTGWEIILHSLMSSKKN